MKDKNINIRVTAEQHKAIMAQARKLGLTVSAYILMLTEGASK
jgi:predicted DNA binding CopG/RHH family protein